MNLNFVPLNKDNWNECARLWCAGDVFVTPNVQSIAEAQFYPKALSRAVFVEDKMIGYAMYGEDEDDSEAWAIDRFMISRNHRRKGYGLEAMHCILDFGRASEFSRFVTSTALENYPMQGLLSKLGFETKHEIRDGEYLYFLFENGGSKVEAE